jgi:sortase (surface protein transpeptidase)
VRLLIPTIGVDTGLEPLGLLADGTLQPPHQWGEAGWYAHGVRPGEPGPAVIAGHVDSRNGPAVFFRLRDLGVGASAIVRTSDGQVLRFVIDTVRRYPKATFPTAAVYGPTPLPELRLVTCTGDFDWAARSYLDNLVVSARLA